jgi:mRNA interferase MazF
MGVFAAGQVVLLSFPFSNLSRSKYRPAVVLARAGQEDWIVCQITSNPQADPSSLSLAPMDFASGGLHHTSYARPAKLFTAHDSLMVSIVGVLKPAPFAAIRTAVVDVICAS